MAANPKVAPMSAKAFSASTIVPFLICLMYGITYIDRNNVSTVASIFERDLHLTNTQIGLFYSAFCLSVPHLPNHRWLDERPVRRANWTDRLRLYLGVRHAIDGHRE